MQRDLTRGPVMASMLLGLCMGSGAVFSIRFGQRDEDGLREGALAHILSAVPAVGVMGIWWSVPVGWLLADAAGLGYYLLHQKRLFAWEHNR